MPEPNEILVQNSIIKSKQALSDAELGLENDRKSLALNRQYYAIFYAVMALGYRNGFTTAKHSQLMGWFNKKFIYQDKTFHVEMNDIYRDAFMNRQEADYELLTASEMTSKQIESLHKDCKYFIETVFEYLNIQ